MFLLCPFSTYHLMFKVRVKVGMRVKLRVKMDVCQLTQPCLIVFRFHDRVCGVQREDDQAHPLHPESDPLQERGQPDPGGWGE